MNPFEKLTQWPQFILYKKDGSKLPWDPTKPRGGEVIDPHNPENWMDSATAWNLSGQGEKYGLGFVITGNDPFFFIDIDHCIDSNGRLNPIAQELTSAFKGAAMEVSFSGDGLHIIGCSMDPGPHKCKNGSLGIEFYTKGRYVALTSDRVEGDSSTDFSHLIPELVSAYFPAGGRADEVGWTSGPVPEWNGYEDDEQLIDAAIRSSASAKIAFGDGATFADLWQCNEEALCRAYPDNYGDRGYDTSSVDAALIQHLAFWTGKDCERIERLMWMSALSRDKWTHHQSYLRISIENGVSVQREVHQRPRVEDRTGDSANGEIELMSTNQILAVDQQIDHFRGCVYIAQDHCVLTPFGAMLKPDTFKVMYGGYLFVLDGANSKTTEDAFKAFTQSRAAKFPKALGTCFKPREATGKIYVLPTGETEANTWCDQKVKMVEGDATPFIDHLTRLLPIESDRIELLNYIAAVVQLQGNKFQWSPFIQGVQGNGKSLISKCLRYAVGRKYVHSPRASELGGQFNDYLDNKVVIIIEDMFVPNGRAYITEILKPMITAGPEDGYEIEGKNKKAVNRELVCNFILNSNLKDGLIFEKRERRFAPFFTAQQDIEDLERDGMTKGYFENLYGWLNYQDGYAIVANFLNTWRLPEDWLVRVGKGRAPATSSTAEAYNSSLGSIEQEVMERIESDTVGMKGGWISSKALDELLDEIGASRKIPRARRRALLQSLGYDWHPALSEGRCHRVTSVDRNKPRLYVKLSRTDLTSIKDRNAVIASYEGSQA